MSANNNLNPEWFPPPEPGELPGTRNWKRLAQQYIYDLRGQVSALNSTVQNVTNNLNQTINQTVVEIINGNNNSGPLSPPVIYGPHVQKTTTNPANANGYIFVETDRNEAQYYSDGLQWLAIIGTGTGSFESRWTGLNSADAGLQWIETSRSNNNGLPPYPLYRWDGNNWNFLSGELYRNQADLSVLAATFASANSNNGNDIGVRVNVTDFHHQLQWSGYNGTVNVNNTATVIRASGDLFDSSGNWNGVQFLIGGVPATVSSVAANNNALTLTAIFPANANGVTYSETQAGRWKWGPDDDLRAGEGPILREVDPDPTTGWALYDGSNATYLKQDGTTGTVTLPNLTSANNVAFLQAGNVNSNINPAVAPGFTGNAVSGSISSPSFIGDNQTFTTANFTANASGTAALTGPSTITPSGSVSTPTFTGNNATGTISNNGVPPNITRRPWFRR